MSFLSSIVNNILPIVKADDDELVDPQIVVREKCAKLSTCMALKQTLDDCNNRVRSKSQTTEICSEEVVNFISCIDHCALKTLFNYLK
uniref:Cytochrome b-c1 complex subunit 6 n=1 Tax=Ceratosolen solmsi TaxID=142686 RepID=A0A0A1CM49_9HYME|nr:mitochondrial cytochrome b-c1 complex subunit 6 [Ceratosolen solmsi]